MIKVSASNQPITLPLLLITLLISTFAIGTTYFVIIDILPNVAEDLNVTLAQQGYWLRRSADL